MSNFIGDIDFVLIHAIRCPKITNRLSRSGLTPEHFGLHTHNHYRIIWKSVLYHYTTFNEPLSKIQLYNYVNGELGACEGYIENLRHSVAGLIELAYSLEEEELSPEQLIQAGIVQRVIDSLVLVPRVSELASISDPTAAAQALVQTTQTYEQSRVVSNVRSNIFDPAEREKYLYDGPPPITGVEWLDLSVNGLYPGSLCGLLAGSAGGKTMAGVQMLCSYAERGECAVGFYYEQELKGDIASRVFSVSAGLTRTDIMDKKYADYSAETLEKLDAVTPIMSKYCHLYDMSGSIKGQGAGCVGEIDTILADMITEGHKPKFVIIDWLVPMVSAAYNLPEHADADNLRLKIDATLQALKRLTSRYGVIIMVLHQIAPHIIENKTPAFKPDWTVAQECKNFGLLMSYVFVFGRKDEKGRMWLNVPKARGCDNTSRIVRMDAECNIIRDVNERFVANPTPMPGSPIFIEKGRNGAVYDDSGGI